MIYVSKKLLGTDSYLAYDGQRYSWSPKPCGYIYGERGPRNLEEILGIFDHKIPNIIDDKYKRMIEVLGISDPYYPGLIGRPYMKSINGVIPMLLESHKK